MVKNQSKMEILRDYWNTEHHRITKLEQIMETNMVQLPKHLLDEILLHKMVERILREFDK